MMILLTRVRSRLVPAFVGASAIVLAALVHVDARSHVLQSVAIVADARGDAGNEAAEMLAAAVFLAGFGVLIGDVHVICVTN
jgi:hypothetical protein